MRLLLLTILWGLPCIVFGQQVNFEDDFTDQDISDWSGNTENFIFSEENGNILLQQNASGAGISYLSIPSTNSVGYWEFFVRFDGFNPSNNNKAEIYLMSDSKDLTSSLNGYKLRGGENGSSDVFRLFKITNGSEENEILTGSTDISAGGDYRVKITRDGSGNWKLEVAKDYAGALSVEDTGTDNSYSSTSFFGFKNTYSSTRSDLFYYDFKIDIPTIKANALSVINDTEIDIAFSRNIDFSTAQISDFVLNPGGVSPQSLNQQNGNTIRISFSSAIPSGPNSLTISGIEDDANETTLADTTFSFFINDEYQTGDVIINEFLKDPPTGTAEYVELKNTTSKYLNLKDWQVGDNNSLTKLSTQDFTLLPDSFVVISADTSTLNTYYGKSHYLQASLPALNNGEDQIRLFNESGTQVDSLQYDSNWSGVDVAIERREASVSSVFRENWGDSPSENFGTPGFTNQIQPDETAPEIEQIVVQDNQTLVLVISERLENSSAETVGNYSLSQDPETGATTPPLPGISSVTQIAPDSLQLSLDDELEEYDGSWTLSANNLTDIFSNSANDEIDFNYYVIFTAEAGQVAINEFMYDPAPDFSEFVELYNHSDSSFDLQGWILNDNNGTEKSITDENYVLPAGDFVILAPDSTIINAYPETPFINMASRFPTLNNGTDAIVIKNQNRTQIDSLTYSSDWGGSEVSLERRTVEVLPDFRENWGDSPSDNLATPGLANQIGEDTTSPGISDASFVKDDAIRLIFSERIQSTPAQDVGNFSLSVQASFSGTLPNLQSATFFSPDTVLLQYDADFSSDPEGTDYELTVSKQADIFNNVAAVVTQSFFLIEFAQPDSGEITINEFMYDPANGFSEFIELFNRTDSAFNLQNWTLNDNTGNRRAISDTSFILNPGAYLVLTPDSTLYEMNNSIPILDLGSRFPSLNNSTDAIVIRNQEGTLIDSLTYFSDWGGETISLERLSPDAPSIYRENWADSPSEDLATPGGPNQVEPDKNPPQIQNISYPSSNSIRVYFDERVDSALAHDLDSYSLSPDISINKITEYAGNSLTLVLGSSLTDGTIYTITVESQQDIFGNELELASVELEYVLISPATPRQVIVNEILYRRATAESEEFVELFNRSSQNFDLSGWTFSDATGSTLIPVGTQILSGEYLILTDSESFGTETADRPSKSLKSFTSVYLPGFPSLNDDEDAVVIKNKAGLVIDSLFYKETWGGDQPGKSLERKDPESASNDASNWATNTSESGNSAGTQSSVFQPDETAPEIVFAKLQPDGRIFIAFSEFVNVNNTEVFVNEEPTKISQYNETEGNVVIVGEDAFTGGEPLSISFSIVTDFRGNTSEGLAVEVSQPLAPGNVVINEILFDPLANSDDNLPDQTEYIELYNRSEYAISLEGFFLHDEPDENNEIRSIAPVSSQFKWIPSGEYALVYSEDRATDFGESQLAEYFEMQHEDDQFYIRIDRSSLSLASSDDAIYLSDSTGTTIDSVFYDESWQNPNLYDTDGVALERIDPTGPSNDGSNWSSSTRVNGGTPGEQNSIFQQAGAGPEETGISFTPNPFSPDDDGFDDNLFINYKLEEPDYLLRIRIFDRYGREVRKLADGKQAGFEGSLIWDGLTDSDQKNRVGIYIVLFEAYNSANGKNKTFKETVVLARKF